MTLTQLRRHYGNVVRLPDGRVEYVDWKGNIQRIRLALSNDH